MPRSGAKGVSPDVAAQAIAIGIIANCALKLALALAFGTSGCRRVSSLTLAAMALAMAVAHNGTSVTIGGTGREASIRNPTVTIAVGHGTPKVGVRGYACPSARTISGYSKPYAIRA